MSQLGVFLARQELRVIFDNFDQNKDGNIAYSEFVNVLRVRLFDDLIFCNPFISSMTFLKLTPVSTLLLGFYRLT